MQAEILTREWEQKRETVRKMKAEGLSFDQIGRISGLSAGEIEKI
jgi:DNA-directed RNA polymerase specialized sigma24 family protein